MQDRKQKKASCDNCKHYQWYYDKCERWDCKVDYRSVCSEYDGDGSAEYVRTAIKALETKPNEGLLVKVSVRPDKAESRDKV